MSKELIERLRSKWRKPENKPPEMCEAADRIEQLEAENAELKNALSSVNPTAEKFIALGEQVVELTQQLAAAQNAADDLNEEANNWERTATKLQIKCNELNAQLAACQAREQQLREALTELLCYNEKTTWVGGTENGYLQTVGSAKLNAILKCESALSIPQDTTALEAAIVKASDVIITKAKQACIDLGAKGIDYFNYTSFVEVIDNLTTVTLNDLK